MGEGTVCNVSDASPSLRDALEYELNKIESSIDAFENEVEALKALIDWHVSVAVDQRTNGEWQSTPPEPIDKTVSGKFGKVMYVTILKGDIEQWREEWLEENDPKDGTDCVTPFDKYLY